MGRYRRKRVHSNDKHLKKKYRTRRRTKDLDEVEVDLLSEAATTQTRAADPDLPGSGQHYCIHCARYFIDESALKNHFTTKLHKRRLKVLSEPVYTQKEADMAAGVGNYTLPPPPLPLEKTNVPACMDEMALLSVTDV